MARACLPGRPAGCGRSSRARASFLETPQELPWIPVRFRTAPCYRVTHRQCFPPCERTSPVATRRNEREKNVCFPLTCQDTGSETETAAPTSAAAITRQPVETASGFIRHQKAEATFCLWVKMETSGSFCCFYYYIVDARSRVRKFSLLSSETEGASGRRRTCGGKQSRDADSPRTLFLLEVVTKKTSSHVGQNSILVRLF